MVRIKLLAATLFLLAAVSGLSQEVRVYSSFDDYRHILQNRNDTTYVVNFWATWCKPCVEEMPGFLALDDKYREKQFKLILTSLDFEKGIESKVHPYILNNDIQTEVVLLSDPKVHNWIDRVNPEWVGSIPATVIYNRDFYLFREGMFTFEELDTIITNNLIP